MKHGDFTELAQGYASSRPGYASSVLDLVAAALGSTTRRVTTAEIAAGTGILSRQLANHGCSVLAVEPNGAMRHLGESSTADTDIGWLEGAAENTGLEPDSYDLVTMASAFHWADFDTTIAEFIPIFASGWQFHGAVEPTRHRIHRRNLSDSRLARPGLIVIARSPNVAF